MERTKKENKALCERYPFLIPWNRWSGKLITDCAAGEDGYWPGNPESHPEYDYEYTELDDMPDGWDKAFGEKMCEEIGEALVEDGDLERWRIVQLKEKWGWLCIYDNGVKVGSRVHDIIRKYESMSGRTCIVCGAPATQVTTGWISPFCDECCINCGVGRSVPIDEYYREDDNDGGEDGSGD